MDRPCDPPPRVAMSDVRPDQARAYIQDDLVSVVVQDTLTKGERSLVQDGRAESL